MSIWSEYQERIANSGATQRDAYLKREKRYVSTKIKNSLSFFEVTIDDSKQSVAIINSDNLNEKKLYTLPNEDIRCGAIVDWMDNHWLVVEKDANTEVYSKAKIIQCNYLLKWVDEEDVIREQWCIVEDGTKLKCIICGIVHAGLAYWKRYAKRTSLIAGTPLEPYKPQHRYETKSNVTV